jgi:hypothetical protein
MRTIAEYREYAQGCRDLAARTTDPNDKRALELMATGWDKVADQREAAINKGLPVEPPKDEVPTA